MMTLWIFLFYFLNLSGIDLLHGVQASSSSHRKSSSTFLHSKFHRYSRIVKNDPNSNYLVEFKDHHVGPPKNYNLLIADLSTPPDDACWENLSSRNCRKEVRLELFWRIIGGATADPRHRGEANSINSDNAFDQNLYPFTTTATSILRGDINDFTYSGNLLKGSYPNVRVVYINNVLSLTVGPRALMMNQSSYPFFQDFSDPAAASHNSLLSAGASPSEQRAESTGWTLSATGFVPDKWYNVTLTFKPTTGLSLFVDGVQRGHIESRQMAILSSPPDYDPFYASQQPSADAHDDNYIRQQTHLLTNVIDPSQHGRNVQSVVDLQVIGIAENAKARTTRSPPVFMDSRGQQVIGRPGYIPSHPTNTLRNSRNLYRISFINNGFIRYTSKDSHLLAQNWEIFLDFLTRSKNGFLFYAGKESENIFLKIEDGNVLFGKSTYGKVLKRLEFLYPPGYEIMPDTQHQIVIKKSGNKITMSIDSQQLKEMSDNFTPLSVGEENVFDFGGTNKPVINRLLSKNEYFNGTFYEISITKEIPEKTTIYPVEHLISGQSEVQVFGTLRYLSRLDIDTPALIDVNSHEGSKLNTVPSLGGETVSFNEFNSDGSSYLTIGSEFFDTLGGSFAASNANRINLEGNGELNNNKRRIISFKLMTNEPRGIVLFDDSSVSVCLEIVNYRLYVIYNDAGQSYRNDVYALPLSQLVNVKYELTDGSINLVVSDLQPISFRLNPSHPIKYGAIHIGGTPKLSALPTLSTNSFTGCIQDLVVNDGVKPIFREDHLNSGNLKVFRVDSCRPTSPRCTRTACSNSGSCREGWNRTFCDCSFTPYAGPNCREEAPTLDLDGSQVIKVILPSNFTSSVTEIALRFKTRHSTNSVVLFADCTSSDNLKIYLEDGKLKVSFVMNGITNTVSSQKTYVDGLWHQVDFRKDGSNVKVKIDDEIFRNEEIYGQNPATLYDYSRPMTIQSFEFGGRREMDTNMARFRGSLQHLVVNGVDYIGQPQPPPNTQIIMAPPEPYMDKREHFKIFSFDGSYYYKKLDDARAFHPTSNVIRVQLRTNRPDGGILSVSSPQSPVKLNLETEASRPKLTVHYDGQQFPIYSHIPISDGYWHDVKIHRDNQVISLSVDNNQAQNPHYLPPHLVTNIYQIMVGASEVGPAAPPYPNGGAYSPYQKPAKNVNAFVGQIKNPQCDGIDLSHDWLKVWIPQAPPPPPPQPPKQHYYAPPVQALPPQHVYPPISQDKGPPPRLPPPQIKAPPQRPPPPPIYIPPPTYPPKVYYRPPPPPPPPRYEYPIYKRPPPPPPPPPQTKAPPLPPPAPPSAACLVSFDGRSYAKVTHPLQLATNDVGNRNLVLYFRTGQQGKTAVWATSENNLPRNPDGSKGNALLYLDEGGVLKLIARFQDGSGRRIDKTLQTGVNLNDDRWHKVRINQRGHGWELIVDDRDRSTNYDDVPGVKSLRIGESYLGADLTDAFSQEQAQPMRGEIKDYTLDNNDILCDWANRRPSSYVVQYPLRIEPSRIINFNGNQFMKVIFPYPNPNFTRNEISYCFNTKNPNGVLFATLPGRGFENQPYLVGMLDNGVLKIIARCRDSYKDIVVGSNLNDGAWHCVKIVHDNENLSVFLDDYPHITSQMFNRECGTNLLLNEAHFGGFETSIPEYAHLSGLSGYMRNIRINSRDFIGMHYNTINRDGHTIYYPLPITRPTPPTLPPPLPTIEETIVSTVATLTPTIIETETPPLGEPPVIAGAGGIVQPSYDVIRPFKNIFMSGWMGPVLAAIAALFPLLAGLLWALYKCKPGICAGPWGRKAVGKADYKPIPLVSQGIQVVDQPQKPVMGYLSGADAGAYSQVQRTRRKEEEEFMIREGGATGGGTSTQRETYLTRELDDSVKALTRALDQAPPSVVPIPVPIKPSARIEKETEEYTKVVRYGGGGGGGRIAGERAYWGGPGPFIGPTPIHEEVRPSSGYDYQIQSINTLNRTAPRDRFGQPRYKETTWGHDQEQSRYEEYRPTDGSGGSPPYFIETPRAATLNTRPSDSSHNLASPPPLLGSLPPQSMMAIESLIVSPDNQYVITGSDTVPPQIWNLETGQISKILEGEEGTSDLYLASPDNRVLVGLTLTEPVPTASSRKKLTTWDIDSGNKTMTYNKDSFAALTLLNDKRTAVATSFDPTSTVPSNASAPVNKSNEVNVTLLDILNHGAVDKRLSYTPTFPLKNVRAFLRKSRDDNFLLAGFFDPTTTGKESQTAPPGENGGLCNIIIVDLGEIRRGNTDSKAFSVTVNSPETVVILNPDRAATGSPKGDITIWNLITGKKQGHLRESGNPNGAAHLGAVTALTSSPDGKYLISASRDTSIKSWQDIGNREYAHKITFHGHKSEVTCLDLSRDGKLLASGSTDKMIRLWNFEDGSHLCSFETSTEILNIKISRDNRTIVAIGQRDGIKKLIILKVLP